MDKAKETTDESLVESLVKSLVEILVKNLVESLVKSLVESLVKRLDDDILDNEIPASTLIRIGQSLDMPGEIDKEEELTSDKK
jgi:hypothetical protein